MRAPARWALFSFIHDTRFGFDSNLIRSRSRRFCGRFYAVVERPECLIFSSRAHSIRDFDKAQTSRAPFGYARLRAAQRTSEKEDAHCLHLGDRARATGKHGCRNATFRALLPKSGDNYRQPTGLTNVNRGRWVDADRSNFTTTNHMTVLRSAPAIERTLGPRPSMHRSPRNRWAASLPRSVLWRLVAG